MMAASSSQNCIHQLSATALGSNGLVRAVHCTRQYQRRAGYLQNNCHSRWRCLSGASVASVQRYSLAQEKNGMLYPYHSSSYISMHSTSSLLQLTSTSGPGQNNTKISTSVHTLGNKPTLLSPTLSRRYNEFQFDGVNILYSVRYFSNESSSTAKNSQSKDQSKNVEPSLQDTEVPLWSFFSNTKARDADGWNDLPHLTQIESSSRCDDGSKTHQPPPLTKVLSILLPETKSLLIALGALTISTAATMQFPNAIGQMIDILSGIPVVDIGVGGGDVATTGISASDGVHAQSTTKAMPQIQHEQQLEQMNRIALQMISFFTIGAVGTFIHSALFDSIGQRIGASLRKQLFTTIIHQDQTFFDQNRAGELANRLSTDVHEVAEHLVQNIAVFLSNVVRSLTAILSMIALSPVLTMYLSPVVPLLGVCAMGFGGAIKRFSKQHLDVLAHSTHVATERFAGIATVMSFGQKGKEVDRYSEVIQAAYEYARRVAVFQGAFLGTSYMVGNAALLGVLWIGGGYVLDGEMTAGQLAGFCMYAGHLADGVFEISESVGGFLKAQGSGARLFALLDKDSITEKGTNATPFGNGESSLILPPNYNPTIRFEDVQFSYPSHPNVDILHRISFSVRQYEMIALTGSSGCGKSSVVSLLLRLYDPTHGSITLDGVDVRRLNVDWLRSQIGTVRQEPILFHASVRLV